MAASVVECSPGKGISQGRIRARIGLRLPSFAPARINLVQKRGNLVQVFRVRAVSTRFQPFRAISIALSGPNRDIYSGKSRGWAGCRRGWEMGAPGGGYLTFPRPARRGCLPARDAGFGTPEVLLVVQEVVSTRLLRVLRGGLSVEHRSTGFVEAGPGAHRGPAPRRVGSPLMFRKL